MEGLEKDESENPKFHLHKGEERFVVYEATLPTDYKSTDGIPDFDVGLTEPYYGYDFTIERKYHPLTPLQLFLTKRDEQLFNILEDGSSELTQAFKNK